MTLRATIVGEAMIELSTAGDHRLRWTFAGDTLNCAVAMAATTPTLAIAYLTGIGADERSAEFVNFCSDLGVDASEAPIVPGRTLGIYWISTERGERRFEYWRDRSAARAVLESGLRLDATPPSDMIVLSGITAAVAGTGLDALLEQVAKARRSGATIAFDTNYRERLWTDASAARAALEPMLRAADIVHASADDTAAIWGEQPRQFIDRLVAVGVREILVTAGAGATEATIEGEQLRHAPADVEVVDTTGAGDAFFGTYLAHRLDGGSGPDSLARAAAVATRATQTAGALGYLAED